MINFFDFKFDTYWRNPENKIYLNEFKEPLPNAPLPVVLSYNHYLNQINSIRNQMRKNIYK